MREAVGRARHSEARCLRRPAHVLLIRLTYRSLRPGGLLRTARPDAGSLCPRARLHAPVLPSLTLVRAAQRRRARHPPGGSDTGLRLQPRLDPAPVPGSCSLWPLGSAVTGSLSERRCCGSPSRLSHFSSPPIRGGTQAGTSPCSDRHCAEAQWSGPGPACPRILALRASRASCRRGPWAWRRRCIRARHEALSVLRRAARGAPAA